jgi:multidrug efflux pump subunit AcrB
MTLDTAGVSFAVSFVGFSGASRSNSSNAGAIFVGPKPYVEGVDDGWKASQLLATLQSKLSAIVDADIFVIPPPPVQGIGTVGGIKFIVQDRAGHGARALQEATDDLVAAARLDPALTGVFTTYRASTPQLYADIDREKAEMLNVPLANIFDALQVNLGSVYVNDFNLFGRTFQVRAQAGGEFRAKPEDIGRLKNPQYDGANGSAELGGKRRLAERAGSSSALQYVSRRRGTGEPDSMGGSVREVEVVVTQPPRKVWVEY